MLVLVHPGHTGTGAVADIDGARPNPPLVEHEEAQRVVDAIVEALQDEGVPVAIPSGKTSTERRQNCIGVGGISLEVHFNAGNGNYTVVFWRRGSKKGKALAELVAARLVDIVPWFVYRIYSSAAGFGRVEDALAWTEPDTSPPGILLEVAFIDNPRHMAWIKEEGNLRNYALAVAAACKEME